LLPSPAIVPPRVLVPPLLFELHFPLDQRASLGRALRLVLVLPVAV
jgi:hypothetical protein